MATATRSPNTRRRSSRSRNRLRNWLMFAALAGPNIALLVIFTYRPLPQSFSYSTLPVFTVTTVGGGMVLGLPLAVLLNRNLKLEHNVEQYL